MLQELIELIKAANGVTPIGLSALLAVIIVMLVRGQKTVVSKMDMLSDNHLHELPVLIENSTRMVDTLARIEVRLGEDLTYIKTKVSEE